MTVEEFKTCVIRIGELLGIEPVFSHGGEVAQLGPHDDIELHRSGVIRRTRYIQRELDPERVAYSMKLEAADRRVPYMRRPE